MSTKNTNEKERVPVTVLTGFLGAGKTTLLNRILTEEHGRRIAVIENEFGEIGIDQALVVNAEEEIFEMNNGCICCTVRGDLIRIIGKLMRRKDKFDHILVETTGLADPSPVAQTFFVDDEMREKLRLDGIVTLVDAKHIWQHLDESNECQEQIAFADVILLNKTDLVSEAQLAELEQRVRGMNALARIHRTREAAVEVGALLDVGGFDLERALALKPTFLEPEYPFEWLGTYLLEGSTAYALHLEAGPDPTMDMLLLGLDAPDDATLDASLELAALIFSSDAQVLGPGERIQPARLQRLVLEGARAKVFHLEVPASGHYLLLTQHRPEEFQARLLGPQGALVPVHEQTFAAGHSHDDTVSSVGIACEGAVNPGKFSAWMSRLLREQGVDLFRTKGILHLAAEERRYVFQGVHMLFDGNFDRAWQVGEKRFNQLVFIGRNLDRAALEQDFAACLVWKEPPAWTPGWHRAADDFVTALAWSADGKRLAAASACGAVLLIDSATGTILHRLDGHDGGTLCLEWSPGDQFLATGGQDGVARVWDLATGQPVAVLAGGAAWVEHLAWGDAPYLLATAAGRHLKFWTAQGALLYTAEPPHTSTVSGLLWQPSLQRFISICYGEVRLHAPLKPQPVDVFTYQGSLIALGVSPDGAHIACGCQDTSVHIWQTATGEDLQMSGYPLKVRTLAWDSRGRLLATGGGPDVTVWDFAGRGPAGQRPRVLSSHAGPVTALAFQSRGTLLASGGPDGVALWNPHKSTKRLAAAATGAPVSVLAWHPAGQVLVTGHGSGDLFIWRPPTEGRGFGV